MYRRSDLFRFLEPCRDSALANLKVCVGHGLLLECSIELDHGALQVCLWCSTSCGLPRDFSAQAIQQLSVCIAV